MVLSRDALLSVTSSLPLGDLDSHAGVSCSWDMAFPDAPLPSRMPGPASCETKLRRIKSTFNCTWSYENTGLVTRKGSPESVRAWTAADGEEKNSNDCRSWDDINLHPWGL